MERIEHNGYSPLNSYTQSLELTSSYMNNINIEDLGKKITELIDSELKELEIDEGNIKLLLEQLDKNEQYN